MSDEVLSPEQLKQAQEGIQNWHATASPIEPLTCYDLQELGLWNCIDCCPGCHEEKAEGYNVMLPAQLAKDGRKVEVCCSIARSDLLVDVEW